MMNHLGTFVQRWAVELPQKHEFDFADSLGGAWYITPTHHALEFLTLTPFYLVMTWYYAGRALSSPTTLRMLTSTENRPPRSLLEGIMLAMMIVSLSMTVAHKLFNGTLLFLMQPCHATAAILILVMCWPNHKYPIIPRVLFNICLHTLWGTILALLWPDLRDHELFGEVFNFFFEHILILIIPLYMTTTGRYPVMPPTSDMAWFSFFLYAAYHNPMLQALSLLSGFNLNYVLVPPALPFLIASGSYYRFIMYMTALLLMFITRYGIVESFLTANHAIRMAILKQRKSA